ncbi:hypothetical protein PHMEG_0009349 [Phytophthora megakarya]|uniref:Integrase catalytic domain-containing protein n=1 Tax=Phytophthora megakarya TaxID=4795 RepID=A0A225WGR7_9STRA|nr:hypothetical protein PHMEG_0009349 [Phytophthora megakarya]
MESDDSNAGNDESKTRCAVKIVDVIAVNNVRMGNEFPDVMIAAAAHDRGGVDGVEGSVDMAMRDLRPPVESVEQRVGRLHRRVNERGNRLRVDRDREPRRNELYGVPLRRRNVKDMELPPFTPSLDVFVSTWIDRVNLALKGAAESGPDRRALERKRTWTYLKKTLLRRNKVNERVVLAQFYRNLDKATKYLVQQRPVPRILEEAVEKATDIDDLMDNVLQGMVNIGQPWTSAPSRYIVLMTGTTGQMNMIPGVSGTSLPTALMSGTNDVTATESEREHVGLFRNPQGFTMRIRRARRDQQSTNESEPEEKLRKKLKAAVKQTVWDKELKGASRVWQFEMRSEFDEDIRVNACIVVGCRDEFLIGFDFMKSPAAVMGFNTNEVRYKDEGHAVVVPFRTYDKEGGAKIAERRRKGHLRATKQLGAVMLAKTVTEVRGRTAWSPAINASVDDMNGELQREKLIEWLNGLGVDDSPLENGGELNIGCGTPKGDTAPIMLKRREMAQTENTVMEENSAQHSDTEGCIPLPRIDETLESLSRALLFTTLDLRYGYWQMRVADTDNDKTAFTTRSDDIIVFTWGAIERHVLELATVLEQLSIPGLTLKLKKHVFATTSLEYLEHELGRDGVLPLEWLVAAVLDFPQPKDETEVKRFVHLAGYYRRFIMDNDARQTTFSAVKNILTTRPLRLAYPIFSVSFRLETDANKTGLGSCVMQDGGSGWRPAKPTAKQGEVMEPRRERKAKGTSGPSDVVVQVPLSLKDKRREEPTQHSGSERRMLANGAHKGMTAEEAHSLVVINTARGRRIVLPPELWSTMFKEKLQKEVRRWVAALDVAGPLPAHDGGHLYVIAAVEYVTNYAVAASVKQHTAEAVARFLMKHVVLRFGPFRELLTDRAPELTGLAIKRLVALLQAEQTTPVPYRPQMIELMERFHRTWKGLVSTYMHTDKQTVWDSRVDWAVYAYKSGRHSVVELSSNAIMMERRLCAPNELLRGTGLAEVTDLSAYHKKLLSEMRSSHECAERARRREQERSDRYGTGTTVTMTVSGGERQCLKTTDSNECNSDECGSDAAALDDGSNRAVFVLDETSKTVVGLQRGHCSMVATSSGMNTGGAQPMIGEGTDRTSSRH